jgi:hypothetical protein
MSAVPWWGSRAYTASFGTGRACGATVGGRGLGGSRRTRTRTGACICGIGPGVIDVMVVRRWGCIARIISKRRRKGGKTIVVVLGSMGGGCWVGIIVGIVEGGSERRKLCGEGELLWLLVLLVGRVWSGNIKDVVTILLLVLWLVVRRSFGGIRRLGRALVRLVMMMLRGLWRIGHQACQFFCEIH